MANKLSLPFYWRRIEEGKIVKIVWESSDGRRSDPRKYGRGSVTFLVFASRIGFDKKVSC